MELEFKIITTQTVQEIELGLPHGSLIIKFEK